ncbi:MAG TPA: LemA family protein, partial [Longimicrobiales bacterium]|nr:LemA family protein [Longimicrobiales bacterium]
ERTESTRANIETELQRRSDLIPNLVATVEEAASFEQETFTQVAEARSGLAGARQQLEQALRGGASAGELSAANQALSENLRLFLNVAVEAYPTLTANRSFIALQDELTETENRLAFARREYNEAVRDYNTYIRRFPALLTARVIGADRREPFEAAGDAREAPQVEFGR